MADEKTLRRVAEHPLFRAVDDTLLRRLFDSGGAFARAYTDGQAIRTPEDTSRVLGLLLSGKAIAVTGDTARPVLLRYLGAGDLFGIANLFCKEHFVSHIRAVSSCVCCMIPEDGVEMLLAESADFRKAYLAFLGGRIRFLNQKIGYLTAGSAERRLAIYLAALGNGEHRLPLSISALSELLDLGRASLYRALEKLETDGLITRRGRNICIADSIAISAAYSQ